MFQKMILFALCLICFGQVFAKAETTLPPNILNTSAIKTTAFNELAAPNIAKVLGWVKDLSKDNLCGGCYVDPPEILAYPNPPNVKTAPTTITAKRPVFFSEQGTSVLQGDVTITQPGRTITADAVTLFRNSKSSKIETGTLLGNVHLREYGKLIVAETSNLDFTNKTQSFNNGVYRIINQTPTGVVSAWGRVKAAFRNALGVLRLTKATYSTCPPGNDAWQFLSNDLVLDKNTGRGVAYNSFFKVKNVPIVYLPYFNFPIDSRRKSGFLMPTFKNSDDSGFDIALPYYFNLAPNYDATLTLEPISKRGILFGGEFRYLTVQNFGDLNVNYIPYDKAFVKFRDSEAALGKPSHALTQLANSSSSRGYVSYNNQAIFNAHWSGLLNMNYASDNYYLQDYGKTPNVIDNDQLLNQAALSYSGENWRFFGRVLAFQTLHTLTLDQPQDQYMRLPQLSLNGNFPSATGGLDYQLSSELVNFEHQNDFNNNTPIVSGGRFNFAPAVSLPYITFGKYFIPKIELYATAYALHDQVANLKNNIMRLIPLFSFDSGLFFSREIHFFSNVFTQTFEPRLFYLLVPKQNQNDIPFFDTSMPAFDFTQLFRSNRFSGYDRIGDANQVSLAITSRFLNDSGQEKLNVGIGEIFAFHKHEICGSNGVNSDCSLDPLAKENLSPIVGSMQYYLTDQWNASGNLAWDPNYQHFNSGSFNLQYLRNANHVVNFWYNFVLNGDSNPGAGSANDLNDLNRIGASVAWNMFQHWNILAEWNYNISHKHAQTYLYGLEYDSCCFAVRFVQSKTFVNIDQNGTGRYKSAIGLQFLLKGLGSIGTSGSMGNLIATQIPGFRDNFVSGFHI